MAEKNLFEKYGIKEVADVTFYRIDRVNETYESQRKIKTSSILKSAIDIKTVYPMINADNGETITSEDGFEAYVFEDAEINRGVNYECDDEPFEEEIKLTITSEALASLTADGATQTTIYDLIKIANPRLFSTRIIYNALDNIKLPTKEDNQVNYTIDVTLKYRPIISKSIYVKYLTKIGVSNTLELESNQELESIYDLLKKNNQLDSIKEGITDNEEERNNIVIIPGPFNIQGEVKTNVDNALLPEETTTYVYKINLNEFPIEYSYIHDMGYDGTHEYTYKEQIAMLFAKNQHLIDKKGTRYKFSDPEKMFGEIQFNDNFSLTPNSSEKVVVLGLPDKFTEYLYDFDEINTAINKLNKIITAKAYDLTYNLYAELLVEDEMGYYNENQLGVTRVYNAQNEENIGTLYPHTTVAAGNIRHGFKIDRILSNAKMWDRGIHYSINDAIEALRAKQMVIDTATDSGLVGFKSIHGGYKVTNDNLDTNENDLTGIYDYEGTDNGDYYLSDGMSLGANLATSHYTLTSVLDALEEISYMDKAPGDDLTVTVQNSSTPVDSNRAIYVRVDGETEVAARAHVYILHNTHSHALASDISGMFEFTDLMGNKCYYKDKVFIGKEYLALVVIGNAALVFVLNRHGLRKIERVGWMVNENGYVNNTQCERIVKNGVIHTIGVTIEDETFDATCNLSNMTVKKIKKRVLKYTPVLFLDTLKVSTLEQTAEQTAAQGGKGNAKLIIWDYGKEITLTLQDALYTPASMSAMLGASKDKDFTKGVKDTKRIDRTEKCTATRSFIIPAGNSAGVPSEGDITAQAVYIDLATMKPYEDGTPIAEGEVYLKWTRSVAYGDNSLGNTIEISADRFPGTYRIVGDTFARNKVTGEDQRFQFEISQAKMSSETTITLEAEGDPTVFDMTMTVLRPDDGVMVKLIQYDVVENTEENDGSTMVKDTENLNLLDDAEMYRVNADIDDELTYIGATEY